MKNTCNVHVGYYKDCANIDFRINKEKTIFIMNLTKNIKSIQEGLNQGQLGIVKIEAIARLFVCWKGTNSDTEEETKICNGCTRHQIKAKVGISEFSLGKYTC